MNLNTYKDEIRCEAEKSSDFVGKIFNQSHHFSVPPQRFHHRKKGQFIENIKKKIN